MHNDYIIKCLFTSAFLPRRDLQYIALILRIYSYFFPGDYLTKLVLIHISLIITYVTYLHNLSLFYFKLKYSYKHSLENFLIIYIFCA